MHKFVLCGEGGWVALFEILLKIRFVRSHRLQYGDITCLGGGVAATIDLCNEVMYVTAQADLPNKGMIPWLCKYLIVTSNDRTAGIQHVFKRQSGAMRRFIFVDLEVKPEYKQAHSDMLAGTGSADDHDFYTIRFRRYVSLAGNYREEYYDYARDKWTVYNQCVQPVMEIVS